MKSILCLTFLSAFLCLASIKNIDAVDRVTLTGHSGNVRAFVQLLNGDLVSSSDDWTMRNWNRNQRIPTKRRVNDFAVLPNGDLVTAQYDTPEMAVDDSLLVWDTNNWTIKRRLLGERDEVLCLALLENGDLVSSIYNRNVYTRNATISVWNPYDGTKKRSVVAHRQSVTKMIQLPNGDLATASGTADLTLPDENYSIKIFDTNTWTIKRIMRGHGWSITGLALQADGKLVSASKDQSVIVWDTDNGSIIKKITTPQILEALAILKNGYFATSGWDKFIRIYDPETSELKYELHDPKHFDHWRVESLLTLSDGRLVSGHSVSDINIWTF